MAIFRNHQNSETSGLIRHLGIPDLRGPAPMHARGNAGNRAFARGIQKIGLEFDGREVVRPAGEIGDGPITAGRVRQGDDRRRVQIPVGGQQFGAQGQAACRSSGLDAGKFNPDQAQQGSLAARIQFFALACSSKASYNPLVHMYIYGA